MKKLILTITMLSMMTSFAYAKADANALTDLKQKIAKTQDNDTQLQNKVAQQNALIEKLQKEIAALKQENERLMNLCRQAGVDTRNENLQKVSTADFTVCPNGLKPNMRPTAPTTLQFTKIEVGAVGWVDDLYLTKIIDSKNAISNINLVNADGSWKMDDKVMAVCQKVWLKGVSTAELKDGARVSLDHHFAVTGTTTYNGENLYVVEPVNLSPTKLKEEAQNFHHQLRQYNLVKTKTSDKTWPKSFTQQPQ